MSARARSRPSARASSGAALAAALLAAAPLAACRPEREGLLPAAAEGATDPVLRTSELQAGGATRDLPTRNPYSGDGVALAEGHDLYLQMNCAGCHGPNGGGGIGPPFADEDWIYGSQPENIVQSILQGRPNGMPSFAGRLPADHAWKIAAYVESIHAKTAPARTGSDAEVRRGGAGSRAP